MRGHNCELCKGRQHIYDKGKRRWVPCSCLRARKESQARKQAGFGERFTRETWQTFIASHKIRGCKDLIREVARLKRGEESSSWFLVSGRPSKSRETIAALIVRSAVEGKHEAYKTSLADLINTEFGRGQEGFDGAARAPVLVLFIGNEPKHTYNKPVLERLMRTRWADNQFLVIVAEKPLSTLKKYYPSGIIGEFFDSNFTKVELSPKEEA